MREQGAPDEEILLPGGVGNAGLVVRVGDTVRRPWRPATAATHELFRYLDRELPGVAPVPVGDGRDEQGREVLGFVEGKVAVEPYPMWVTDEDWLVSAGELIRRIHDALADWRPDGSLVWSGELPDPHGGPVIVHADICLENIVTRDGRAAAVIDWEFAAPGRRVWDVVSAARFLVPYTSPPRRDPVYSGVDVDRRLMVFLDSYGLARADREVFAAVLDERRVAGERFTRRRVARGEPAFVQRWGSAEGEERFAAERRWVMDVTPDLALG